MTDVNRHRTGYVNYRDMTPDSLTVIEAGDAVWYDGDDPKPASDVGWDTGEEAGDEANCRKYFAARCAGVALDASPTLKTSKIRIAHDGEWEFPCESVAYEVGDLFGPAGVDTPKNLADQSLLKVNDPREASFIATRRAGSATTTVYVRPLCGAERANLMASVHVLKLPEIDLVAANDPACTNYTFGKRVRVLELGAIVTTTVAADQTPPVIGFKNGATEADDSLTIADAVARGAIATQAIDDASGDDVFEAEDELDVYTKTAAVDAGTEAGNAEPYLVYCDLPANK